MAPRAASASVAQRPARSVLRTRLYAAAFNSFPRARPTSRLARSPLAVLPERATKTRVDTSAPWEPSSLDVLSPPRAPPRPGPRHPSSGTDRYKVATPQADPGSTSDPLPVGLEWASLGPGHRLKSSRHRTVKSEVADANASNVASSWVLGG